MIDAFLPQQHKNELRKTKTKTLDVGRNFLWSFCGRVRKTFIRPRHKDKIVEVEKQIGNILQMQMQQSTGKLKWIHSIPCNQIQIFALPTTLCSGEFNVITVNGFFFFREYVFNVSFENFVFCCEFILFYLFIELFKAVNI